MDTTQGKTLENEFNCFLLAVSSEKLGENDSWKLAQCNTTAIRLTPRNQETIMTIFQNITEEHEAWILELEIETE